MEPEGNRRSAGPEIDAEMNKACDRLLQLVDEAKAVMHDPKARSENLKERIAVLEQIQAINQRAIRRNADVRRRTRIAISLIAWVGVWGFWLLTTRKFHPTVALAFIVTTALVAAYATAAYLNHLVLLPRLWDAGRRWQYLATLIAVMVTLTAAALAVIRFCYWRALGPDPDPNGLYKHFAIDFGGMVGHVLAAAGIVAVAKKVGVRSAREAPAESASTPNRGTKDSK